MGSKTEITESSTEIQKRPVKFRRLSMKGTSVSIIKVYLTNIGSRMIKEEKHQKIPLKTREKKV